MFSKIILCLMLLASTLLILINCSGENQKAKVPELKVGGCLSQASQSMDLFMAGKASSEDVNLFWSCMQATVSTFETYFKGGQEGRYKSTELRKFLQDRFMKSTLISDDLLLEVMQLKRLIVKGDVDAFTRVEVLRLQAIMKQFRLMTLKLAPHMSVFSKSFALKARTEEGRKQFAAANMAFIDAFKELGLIVAHNKEDYDLSRLSVLLNEFDKLSKKDKPSHLAAIVPLLQSFKAAFISQPQNKLVADDFPALFKVAGDMLFIYLKSAYYVDKTWEKSPGIDDLNEVFERGITLLQEGVERNPKKIITFSELEPIFKAMGDLDIIPLGLKAPTAQDTVKVLLQKAFKTAEAPEVIDGLTLDGIRGFRSEWQGFINAQKYAEASVNQKSWAEVTNEDAKELKRAATSPFPLEKDKDARLVLKYRTADWFFDLHSLTGINWQRLIIRLLIKGYAKDKGLIELKGLTQDQLMQASRDLWTLGMDVGFFTPDKPDIYKRVFQEANLFMPRSNGDDIVDYEEGIDYLAFALSGINMRAALLEKTVQACPMQIVNDEKQIDVQCFRNELSVNRDVHMANLPGLIKDFEKNYTQWPDLEKNFEVTVRKKGFSNNPITGSEMAQFFILSQYVEMFMLRFDENRTQSLNLDESYVVYGIFKRTLKELLGGFVSTDDELLNIYTFMFNYGQTPLAGMNGALRYTNWRVKRELGLWEYEADRIRLSQILSSLSTL